MAMNIKYGVTRDAWKEWHLGEAIPEEMHERVVIVQLDGDELNLLLGAMQLTSTVVDGIGYTKIGGFFTEPEETEDV